MLARENPSQAHFVSKPERLGWKINRYRGNGALPVRE
jgi:hypothetical protein